MLADKSTIFCNSYFKSCLRKADFFAGCRGRRHSRGRSTGNSDRLIEKGCCSLVRTAGRQTRTSGTPRFVSQTATHGEWLFPSSPEARHRPPELSRRQRRVSCAAVMPASAPPGPRISAGRSASGHQVQPRKSQFFRDVRADRNAVRIRRKQAPMLREPESKGVYAHAPRTRPVCRRGVIPDPLELHKACSQVPDGIASHDQRLGARPFPNSPVKLGNDFGRRL